MDAAYLDQLARVDLHGHADVKAVTERLGRILEALVRATGAEVVLLDARTGFHDVGGVALAALFHGAVFFGLPNQQSWHGLSAVGRMLAGAGHDDDGAPVVWLEVVHALAPPGHSDAEDDERRRFAMRARDLLAEHYFAEGAVPESIDVVELPYRDGLRGAGDTLNPRTLDILRDGPWKELARRVAEKHALLEEEPP